MSNIPSLSSLPPSTGPFPSPLADSAANALAGNLKFGGKSAGLGPVAQVIGFGPPAYDHTGGIAHYHKALGLAPSNPLRPSLLMDENGVTTEAISGGIGVDAESSHGEATIGSAMFLLTDNPGRLAIASVLGLAVMGSDIQVSANFSEVFGVSQHFVNGAASFGALTISGGLIGKTLTFSGDAAPNTVLFSSPTVTVTLNKQVVNDLISVGNPLTVSPQGISVAAIDISFHDAHFLGMPLSGDLIIGQASAGMAPILDPPPTTV